MSPARANVKRTFLAHPTDMKPGLYPPEAADAFLGNHVFVADDGGEGRKLQGVVVAADYLEAEDAIRLTVEAMDVPSPGG
jgi:hypothetical protein